MDFSNSYQISPSCSILYSAHSGLWGNKTQQKLVRVLMLLSFFGRISIFIWSFALPPLVRSYEVCCVSNYRQICINLKLYWIFSSSKRQRWRVATGVESSLFRVWIKDSTLSSLPLKCLRDSFDFNEFLLPSTSVAFCLLPILNGCWLCIVVS